MNFSSDQSARRHTQALWNQTPCGAIEGIESEDLDYFSRAELHRYHTEPWIKAALPFEQYKGKKVLEIGIGQGTDLAQFAKHGALCHGIDITDEHLRLTGKNLKARAYNVELKKCDATAIAYPDDSFDLVYSVGVIHHIPEKQRVLNEIARVLKPGGLFVGATYRKWSAFHLFQKLLTDGVFYGGLLRLGYRGLLGTLERGADGVTIKPFIELYTKKSFLRVCDDAGLKVSRVRVAHLNVAHFGALRRFVSLRDVRRWEDTLGWYVIVDATKATS